MPIENMKKLPIKDILSDPTTYITDPGTLTVNLSDFVVSVHDGITPGGLPLGGGSGGTVSWNAITGKPTFATVATSGAYTDLTGKPVLSPVATGGTLSAASVTGLSLVATSGAYTDLIGSPTLAPVATSGAYTDLTGKPVLALVATSGLYNDLTGSPTLAPVAISGSYTDLSGTPVALSSSILPQATTTLYVSKSAITGVNPITPNGSQAAPFSTIQAAADYATTTFPVSTGVGETVAIFVGPGEFDENVTITRPLMHLIGVNGRAKGTQLNGNMIINPSVEFGLSQVNNTLSIQGIFLSAPTGDVLSFQGTNRFTFYGRDLGFYANPGSAGACIAQTNTSVGGTKLFFYDVDVNGSDSTGPTVNVSNSYFFVIQQANIDTGHSANGLSFTTSSVTLSTVSIDAGNTGNIVDIPTGSATIMNCYIQGSGANSNGFNLGATSTLTLTQNTLGIPAGTGFVVNGVAGAALLQSVNSVLPGKNVVISSDITNTNMITTISTSGGF